MDNEQETETPAEELPLDSAGAILRRERKRQGFSLERVTEQTRIPERHLKVMESGDFAALPARTYAIGFSRTYAKLLGLDEIAIADQVRAELAEAEADRQYVPAGMEPGDPAKLPSSGLAWAGALGAILLVAGMVTFYNTNYSSGAQLAPLVDDDAPQIAEGGEGNESGAGLQQAASTSGDGKVVFTALEEAVWVKFYDAEGNQLLQKEMTSGERFEIPSDAQGPQIWTGRPDAFAITIDGRSVPKLAEDDFIMRDVAISAEALLARASQSGQANLPGNQPDTANN